MRVFIAGVMQGNRSDCGIHSQAYRAIIAEILAGVIDDLEIVDPDQIDPARLEYDDEQAAEIFFKYCRMAGEVDLLVAYLPEASMGTAVEMWNAHQAGIPVLTISPLRHNWAIRCLSTRLFSDLDAFRVALHADALKSLNLGTPRSGPSSA